jgi:hypothetical protein
MPRAFYVSLALALWTIALSLAGLLVCSVVGLVLTHG